MTMIEAATAAYLLRKYAKLGSPLAKVANSPWVWLSTCCVWSAFFVYVAHSPDEVDRKKAASSMASTSSASKKDAEAPSSPNTHHV